MSDTVLYPQNGIDKGYDLQAPLQRTGDEKLNEQQKSMAVSFATSLNSCRTETSQDKVELGLLVESTYLTIHAEVLQNRMEMIP